MILMATTQFQIIMILFTLSLFLNKDMIQVFQFFQNVNLCCSPLLFSDRKSKEHLWDNSLLENELITHRSNIYSTNRNNL
jgi:hypothetical protein